MPSIRAMPSSATGSVFRTTFAHDGRYTVSWSTWRTRPRANTVRATGFAPANVAGTTASSSVTCGFPPRPIGTRQLADEQLPLVPGRTGNAASWHRAVLNPDEV